MRRPSKGHAFLYIHHLSSQSKISNFDLLIFDENICRFDIPMKKAFRGEITASRYDLFGEVEYVLFPAIEEMVSDVFLQILLTVLEEKVEIVGGLLDVEELYNVGMFEILQSLVLFLHPFDEITHFVFQKFLDILLLNDLDRIGLIVVFVLVGLKGAGEPSSPQALVHLYHVASHFLVLFFHFYLCIINHLKWFCSQSLEIGACFFNGFVIHKRQKGWLRKDSMIRLSSLKLLKTNIRKSLTKRIQL